MSKSLKKYLSIFFGCVWFILTFQVYTSFFESLEDFLNKLEIFIVLTSVCFLFLYLEKFSNNHIALELFRLIVMAICILIDFYFFVQILLYPMVAWSMGFFIVVILETIISILKSIFKMD
jgi:hypothetical protein